MEARTVDLDGPVHYLAYPGPADGPSFVLVHGLGGCTANWLALAPELAQRGRVFVPDFRGFGRTPLGAHRSTIHHNRRLIEQLCDALDARPAILVGNSMGGLVSLLLAAAHPESVAGLVLIDPAAPRLLTEAVDPQVAALFAAYMVPRVGEAFVNRRIQRLGPARIAQETLRLCTVSPSRVPPEVVEAGLAIAVERAERMPWATTAFLQAARSMVRVLARRRRFYQLLASIQAPALLIAGREDRLVPLSSVQAIADRRPDWELAVLDDLGHVPMMEDPTTTLAIIEGWLDRLPERHRRPARGSPRRPGRQGGVGGRSVADSSRKLR